MVVADIVCGRYRRPTFRNETYRSRTAAALNFTEFSDHLLLSQFCPNVFVTLNLSLSLEASHSNEIWPILRYELAKTSWSPSKDMDTADWRRNNNQLETDVAECRGAWTSWRVVATDHSRLRVMIESWELTCHCMGFEHQWTVIMNVIKTSLGLLLSWWRCWCLWYSVSMKVLSCIEQSLTTLCGPEVAAWQRDVTMRMMKSNTLHDDCNLTDYTTW